MCAKCCLATPKRTYHIASCWRRPTAQALNRSEILPSDISISLAKSYNDAPGNFGFSGVSGPSSKLIGESSSNQLAGDGAVSRLSINVVYARQGRHPHIALQVAVKLVEPVLVLGRPVLQPLPAAVVEREEGQQADSPAENFRAVCPCCAAALATS